MRTKSTLLAALWEEAATGSPEGRRTIEALSRGDLQLTGNFRGKEQQIVAQATKLQETRKP